MLISVCTPTNNTRFLLETFKSLEAQNTSTKWEWVLCPNGKAIGSIPLPILEDPRVRIVNYPLPSAPGVGALKKYCFDAADGNILVELDHDDLLLPDALECIRNASAGSEGFIYSDTAVFKEDGSNAISVAYSGNHGWESYSVAFYGKYFLASRCFDISPRSLCEVYYAPDHVRCWTRKLYDELGGHNESLPVADDHDLMCRTYLAGASFKHTGRCNYLYRMHADNTVKKLQPQIREHQSKNREKYLPLLINKWLQNESLESLDISDIKWTESRRLPYEDSSIGHVNVLRNLHTLSSYLVPSLLNEIYRVLVPNGWATFEANSTDGQSGFTPDALSYWNEYTFEYFTKRSLCEDLMNTGKYEAKFQLVNVHTKAPDANRPKNKTVHADLMAIKSQRVPGRYFI